MNVSPVACALSVLASSCIVRPQCSGSRQTPALNVVHIRTTSWYSQGRALLPVFLALVVFPTSVSAAPPTPPLGAHITIDGIHRRQSPQNNNNNSSGSGSISLSVWLPILLVTVVFVLFSLVTCIRRCAASDAAATSASSNQAGTTLANESTIRPRRRPRRTPSQISTKSLPAYMKEPGDHELVLFRGPSDMEDDMEPPRPMPTLAEDDEEHSEMRGATFDIALGRVETVDTMADSSSTNLIRRVSVSMPRPPELDHAAIPSDHRRSGDAQSMDSAGSEAELLAAHQRNVSADVGADPRGEAPAYTEAVSAEGGMTTISLNDPEPNTVSSNAVVPPSQAAGRRSRLSFLIHNPFSSHNHNEANDGPSNGNHASPSVRSESPALHVRSGSALSRLSTHESHESHHSRAPSRNNYLSRSHSRSSSNLFRVIRSHSPGLHAGSSTISLDNISAPLTHTATRAEFHAPKGGLLTPEQIKLITSKEALERFGVPYGPDAISAFSLSRERLSEIGPPPDFESATGQQEQASGSGSGGSATEATPPRSETLDGDPALPRSTSHRAVEPAGSPGSTVRSYATAHESDGNASQAQIVQTYAPGSDGEGEMGEAGEPRTARPMTPRTAPPLNVSGDH